ncbi:MAG TPA: hypothetical protein VMP01_20955 [Pirellulaceae bacterium]|nr:hypothetical protein [Pirellulaceae bacterium]
MEATTEKAFVHIGESRGCENHDHDLVHELSRRLDCLWRYDQYIANAEEQADLQKFWREVKAQENKNIEQLKKLLAQHVQGGCF